MPAYSLRLSAFGDAIMISSIFPYLKRGGYHLTLNIAERIVPVLQNNPYVDDIIVHETNSILNDKLGEHWDKLSQGYDRVINLSQSIEKGLLAMEGSEEFWLPKEERHRMYNYNYYDRTMEIAGYPIKGTVGELYFSQYEKMVGRALRKKYKNKFLILWALSGSSYHKAYPHTELCIREFLSMHKDAFVITCGDVFCKVLETDLQGHPQIKLCSDEWGIRKSMLTTKIADLVIGTETGITNAVGCYDTPKIVLLSHSSKENLTKYFKNCFSLYAQDCDCYPCHRLIYSREVCPVDAITRATKCMANISPDVVLDCMETVYERWKEGRSK